MSAQQSSLVLSVGRFDLSSSLSPSTLFHSKILTRVHRYLSGGPNLLSFSSPAFQTAGINSFSEHLSDIPLVCLTSSISSTCPNNQIFDHTLHRQLNSVWLRQRVMRNTKPTYAPVINVLVSIKATCGSGKRVMLLESFFRIRTSRPSQSVSD